MSSYKSSGTGSISWHRLLTGLILTFFASSAAAQDKDLHKILSAPIAIERETASSSIPLEHRAGKLFLTASINDEAGQFIFDTGSPTILSRRFADTLDLQVIGQNTGRDANGTEVTMDIAIAEAITLGEVTFKNVPVLIHDFSNLALGPCFIDGGVIGSEIFPDSVWRIDLGNKTLTIAESDSSAATTPNSVDVTLHDFGYPHAPIIDYSVADISDKALFDTGNAGQVTFFRKVLMDDSVQQSFIPGTIITGNGSEGESAGGRGKNSDLIRFELSNFELSGKSIGRLSASARAVPPTLLGAGILSTHIVTLDFVEGRFLLEERQEPAPTKTHPGYAIAYVGDEAKVVQIFDGSAAAKAGLRLSDQVTEINGRSLLVSSTNPRCESARWLIENFVASNAADLTVLRKGKQRSLKLPAPMTK